MKMRLTRYDRDGDEIQMELGDDNMIEIRNRSQTGRPLDWTVHDLEGARVIAADLLRLIDYAGTAEKQDQVGSEFIQTIIGSGTGPQDGLRRGTDS